MKTFTKFRNTLAALAVGVATIAASPAFACYTPTQVAALQSAAGDAWDLMYAAEVSYWDDIYYYDMNVYQPAYNNSCWFPGATPQDIRDCQDLLDIARSEFIIALNQTIFNLTLDYQTKQLEYEEALLDMCPV